MNGTTYDQLVQAVNRALVEPCRITDARYEVLFDRIRQQVTALINEWTIGAMRGLPELAVRTGNCGIPIMCGASQVSIIITLTADLFGNLSVSVKSPDIEAHVRKRQEAQLR